MKFRDAVGKAITGRRSQKVTNRNVLETSKSAFGDRPWKEIARETGISERTMRRIRAGGRPSKSTQAKLDTLSKRPEVREAAMKPARRRKRGRAQAEGAVLKLRAFQGPRGKGAGDYRRMREVECRLPGEVMQDLHNAYAEGDDARAEQVLQDAIAEHGWATWDPHGWQIGDVEKLEFD